MCANWSTEHVDGSTTLYSFGKRCILVITWTTSDVSWSTSARADGSLSTASIDVLRVRERGVPEHEFRRLLHRKV